MAAVLPTPTDCCQTCVSNPAAVITDLGNLIGWFRVISLALARAIPNLVTNQFLSVSGQVTGGDGFLGEFTWDLFSVSLDDGANVLKPNDTDNAFPGRWIRQI
jgi:hypothetical protein